MSGWHGRCRVTEPATGNGSARCRAPGGRAQPAAQRRGSRPRRRRRPSPGPADGVDHPAPEEPWLMMHTPSTPSSMAPPEVSGSSARRRPPSEAQHVWACTPASASSASSQPHHARIPPSRAFSATLPVKPSVTTTSTSSVQMSRPSTLPMNVRRPWPRLEQGVGLLDERVALAALLADGQQARPGAPRCRSGGGRAPTPIWANWTSHSGWHSALAPASSRIVGSRRRARARRWRWPGG